MSKKRRPTVGQINELLLPSHAALSLVGTEHFNEGHVNELAFGLALAAAAARRRRNAEVSVKAAAGIDLLVAFRDGARESGDWAAEIPGYNQLVAHVQYCDRFLSHQSAAALIVALHQLDALT